MNISAKHSIRLAVTLTVEIHNHKQKILRKCTSKILWRLTAWQTFSSKVVSQNTFAFSGTFQHALQKSYTKNKTE